MLITTVCQDFVSGGDDDDINDDDNDDDNNNNNNDDDDVVVVAVVIYIRFVVFWEATVTAPFFGSGLCPLLGPLCVRPSQICAVG